MLVILVFHLAIAIAASVLSRRLGRGVFLLAATAPTAATAWALAHGADILAGSPVTETWMWAPDLGVNLTLRVDAFALLMIALVSGIGILIFTYSRWYFADRPDIGRLAGLLVAFAGAMLGLVVTDNLLALFLFWELTSITSYLLIGFDDRSAAARASALRALLITAAGGLAMLAGFVLLAQVAGTYSLASILANPPSGRAVDAALMLILLGAFTKSAQAPFHFWLPGAMAAPTPVSAYLHSATMVKAGVYLIARLAPAFADVWFWRPLVVGVGLTTMFVGGWHALRQRDLKLLLAHGTTSQLGLLVVLLGAGFEHAALAGTTLLVAHAAFKAALFMVVGIVDHQAGTRDLAKLDGLHRSLRTTFVVAAVAVASMAGLPPFFGFIAKEGAFAAFLDAPIDATRATVVAAMTIGAAFTFAYSARFLWGAFAQKASIDLVPERDRVVTTASPPSWLFLLPAALLSILTILFGLWPLAVDPLVNSAARAIDVRVPSSPLALWHGLNAALALSGVAIAGGVWMLRSRQQVAALQERLHVPVDGARLHDLTVAGILRLADRLTGRMQTGSLPMYLMVILGTAVIVPGTIFLLEVDVSPELMLVDRPMQLAIAAMMFLATFVALRSHHRLVAVVAVSVVGYGIAFLFVVQGAPDLALTQLLIETLLLVLCVVVLRHLPRTFATHEQARWQVPRVLVAIGVGVFMTAATIATTASRVDASVSAEYLARALPEGDGRNVVNVILVDFRAFDTFGEIVVLTVAALGVIGLIRSVRRSRAPDPDSPADAFRPSPILDSAVRVLFHTVLLFSLVLLVIGHDRPGGGFIGGLVGGAAFILVYLAGGDARFKRTEPALPEIFLGTGVALAAAIGAAAWLTGGEFLQAMVFYRELPLIGTIKISSVFVFDVGVYLVVIGLVTALLRSFGNKETLAR